MAHTTKTYLLRNLTKLPEEDDKKSYINVLTLYKKVFSKIHGILPRNNRKAISKSAIYQTKI